MQRITQEVIDTVTLRASLQRLGVTELEERLEFSPLLVESGLQQVDPNAPTMCCVCKIPDDDFRPNVYPAW